jgi:hypothetical protein
MPRQAVTESIEERAVRLLRENIVALMADGAVLAQAEIVSRACSMLTDEELLGADAATLPDVVREERRHTVSARLAQRAIDDLAASGRLTRSPGGRRRGIWWTRGPQRAPARPARQPAAAEPVAVAEPAADAEQAAAALFVAEALANLPAMLEAIEATPAAQRAGLFPQVLALLAAATNAAERAAFIRRAAPVFGMTLDEVRDAVEERRARDNPEPARVTDAQILGRLTSADNEVTVFLAPDGETAYAEIRVDRNGATHREVLRVTARAFRLWLAGAFFDERDRPPSDTALNATLEILEARARSAGVKHPVHVRVGGDDGVIYLDLVNDRRQAVAIAPDGWAVVDDPPVKFRREKGMQELPLPTRGGTLDELRRYVNLGTGLAGDRQWVLFVVWLTAVLRPTGPYTIVELIGESGSAKTTTARVPRWLVDPHTVTLRGEPRSQRDLMIAASNNWIVGYDNVSSLPIWLSDALCRLSTGGGFGTRTLHANEEETLFDVERPAILTGVAEIGSAPDLVDRTLRFMLPQIPAEERQEMSAFKQAFMLARPRLLGALLDTVSGALRHLPDVALTRLPRMADFAKWGVAVERACGWPDGTFLSAYATTTGTAHQAAFDGTLIGEPLVWLLKHQNGVWRGTAKELLVELTRHVSIVDNNRPLFDPAWPKTPQGMSAAMRRLAPSLRGTGWTVVLPQGDQRESVTRRRIIALRCPECLLPSVRPARARRQQPPPRAAS